MCPDGHGGVLQSAGQVHDLRWPAEEVCRCSRAGKPSGADTRERRQRSAHLGSEFLLVDDLLLLLDARLHSAWPQARHQRSVDRVLAHIRTCHEGTAADALPQRGQSRGNRVWRVAGRDSRGGVEHFAGLALLVLAGFAGLCPLRPTPQRTSASSQHALGATAEPLGLQSAHGGPKISCRSSDSVPGCWQRICSGFLGF